MTKVSPILLTEMTLDCQLLVPRVLALGWNLFLPESNYVGVIGHSVFGRLDQWSRLRNDCPPRLAVEDQHLSGHCVEFSSYSNCVWFYIICIQGIELVEVETPETPQNMPWPLRHPL